METILCLFSRSVLFPPKDGYAFIHFDSILLLQAITLLMGLILLIVQLASKDLASHQLEIAATVFGLISLMIGELGYLPTPVFIYNFLLRLAFVLILDVSCLF